MTFADTITSVLPPSCTISVPSGDEDLHSILSRWSDLGVKLPAAIVVPSTEDDISAVIKFALEHNLRVIPGNGGHGVFVPIDEKTIYLDMKKFNAVTVNKDEGLVTIGGGVSTGDVLRACAAEGCYTLTPNSDAPGFVGAFLGCGNSSTTGLHGLIIDHVRSICLITAADPTSNANCNPSPNPTALTLTPSSTAEHASLFAALRGAGHGLGVVTSLTIRAFPISSLGMQDNRIWNRKVILPGSAITAVAEAYTALLPPPPPFSPTMIFSRAPGSGAPVLILSANFYGAPEDAEAAAAPLLTDALSALAIVAETALVPFADVNRPAEALSAHGGYKEMYNAFLSSVSASSIVAAFEAFVAFGEGNPDARSRSYAVIGSCNTDAARVNAAREGEGRTFFEHRDRGVFFQFTPWYQDVGTRGAAEEAGKRAVGLVREEDERRGLGRVVFANNMLFGMDVGEVYTKEEVEEVRRVKEMWDPEEVFWSPVSDERFVVRGEYL